MSHTIPRLRRATAPALARCLALAALALALDPSPAAAQQTVTIEVFNFDFGVMATNTHVNPTIQVGDSVKWVFVDGIHSTTSAGGQAQSWDSGILFPPSE